MTENRENDLDGLLQRWSNVHEPSPEQLEQLSVQVEQTVAGSGFAIQQEASASELVALADRSSWNSSWTTLSSVAAIVLVVCTGGWIVLQQQNPDIVPPIALKSIDAPIDAISAEQLLQKQSVLNELDRMFGGKRIWFAETDSDVVLGGESKPKASDIATERSVAMRLVLAKRSSPNESWQRVWSADVVSRTDQVVQFESSEPRQASASFTTWAHLLPDGMIACDVALKWNDGKAGQLSDSLLLSPGDTKPGTLLNVDGVQYQLFHAISILDSAARDA
ncbi:MAG: hypothetical protein WBD20_13440 [Pirellulaceae bacterium]